MNRKINSDGSKSAIQFFDGTNNLNGPVELIEVDESELMRIQNEQGIHPIVKYVIDNILAPYITRELERGTDYLLGMCVFETQDRTDMIGQIRKVMPHIKDSDMEELGEQVLGKLQNMADEEFAEISLEAAE